MKKYIFEPCPWDRLFAHSLTPPAGTVVRKFQPLGCPKNGTMKHCYVQNANTGEKYGLVHISSLTPKQGFV